jgi:hypothetical protein
MQLSISDTAKTGNIRAKTRTASRIVCVAEPRSVLSAANPLTVKWLGRVAWRARLGDGNAPPADERCCRMSPAAPDNMTAAQPAPPSALEPTLARLLRPSRTLGYLNTVVVAMALAASTTALVLVVYGRHLDKFDTLDRLGPTFATCWVSTLLCGLIWGQVVRQWHWNGYLRWGLCVPLAAVSSGICAAIYTISNYSYYEKKYNSAYLSHQYHDLDVLSNMLWVMSVGSIVWVPAVLATLLVFGLPLRQVERAHAVGLFNVDRAEYKLGLVAALSSLVASTVHLTFLVAFPMNWTTVVFGSLSVFGSGLGARSAVYAHRRIVAREHWIARIRAGECAGFAFATVGTLECVVQLIDVERTYRRAELRTPLLVMQPSGDVQRAHQNSLSVN